jgi:hypothetical protein
MYLQAVDLLGVAKAPKYLFVAVYQKAWKEIAKGIPRHVFLVMITVLDGICEAMRCSNYSFFL